MALGTSESARIAATPRLMPDSDPAIQNTAAMAIISGIATATSSRRMARALPNSSSTRSGRRATSRVTSVERPKLVAAAK